MGIPVIGKVARVGPGDVVTANPVSGELTMSIRLTSAKSTYEC